MQKPIGYYPPPVQQIPVSDFQQHFNECLLEHYTQRKAECPDNLFIIRQCLYYKNICQSKKTYTYAD